MRSYTGEGLSRTWMASRTCFRHPLRTLSKFGFCFLSCTENVEKLFEPIKLLKRKGRKKNAETLKSELLLSIFPSPFSQLCLDRKCTSIEDVTTSVKSCPNNCSNDNGVSLPMILKLFFCVLYTNTLVLRDVFSRLSLKFDDEMKWQVSANTPSLCCHSNMIAQLQSGFVS